MAQLSDDCFAFGGALLPVAEMERLIAERVTPVTGDRERAACRRARPSGGAGHPRADRPSAVRQFGGRRLRGAPCRSCAPRAIPGSRSSIASPPAAPRPARSAPGEAIRIFTGAPMPAGADTVFMQEDTRVEGDAVIVPPGLKRGANSRAAGEDVRANSGDAAGRGGGSPRAHVALAAAVGLTTLPVRRQRAGRGVLDRRRDRRARQAAAAGRAVRRQPLPARRTDRAHRRELHRSRHPARRQGAARARDRGGRRRPRSRAHLRRRFDRRGRSRARRCREHRQAGVLAGRHQARPAGGDGRDRGDAGRRGRRLRRVCRAIRSRCS